ncbi:MAG: L,D-transpeptidase [Chloroflexi bacterium]|nr:L,D-transpeptidase [Chloroflexota bacterium]
MTSRVTGLLLGLVIVLLGAATWTATASQALSPMTPPTPTYVQSFAIAELAKPTYTPLPPPIESPLGTITPTQEPTATLQAIAEAVIVDSPERAHAAEAQAPVNYSGGKKILVDISEQHMYVYDGELLVYSFVSSTGMNNATRAGTFSVLDKIPNAYGATWNIWMPNWLGIYWAGSLENGIHALPILPNGATLWAGFLGSPISYGCVVLDTYDAQVLYDWAEVGVPVEIQW